MIEARTVLRQYREALHSPKVTQEQLAQRAKVTRQWLHQLEAGKQTHISYTTAHNLLSALNTERQARQLPALTIEQLNLTIV